MKLKVQYNSPVILTFALVATAVLVLDRLMLGQVMPLFAVGGTMDPANPFDWFRLFSHVLGHAGAGHLLANLMLILLIGPVLEEKYGARTMVVMILVTAGVTGLLNVALFSSGLFGASGVVFMLIILSSFTNLRDGHIPLTFVLVVSLYLGQEIVHALGSDNVSQFAHVLGGACGSAFGFLGGPSRR